MAAGSVLPPVSDYEHPTGVRPILVRVPEPDFKCEPLAYWTQFENLLGERFEVVSYHDPDRRADFRRLT